jgi:hypothetical protein
MPSSEADETRPSVILAGKPGMSCVLPLAGADRLDLMEEYHQQNLAHELSL